MSKWTVIFREIDHTTQNHRVIHVDAISDPKKLGENILVVGAAYINVAVLYAVLPYVEPPTPIERCPDTYEEDDDHVHQCVKPLGHAGLHHNGGELSWSNAPVAPANA